ncbi:uncharacterized protein J7T54_006557 [Emericellopsis cladophorae]|uniref:Uncharacterized protein n=1 Tax=Emericellopsis cladophorae TaxID=2686198 RepID=A0A9P9Y6R9_9HYPO|nr:uncharacterized protein J7T54_006557 [Emericellopsis cladophorae]KAI6784512.1 hypothetical protein J7T54_006557 [Emericellopsis cladophorae]
MSSMSDPHKPFAGPLPPLPSASTSLPSIHYVEGPFYSALHQAWDTTATTSSKSPFSDELRAAIDKAEEKTKVNLPGRSRSYHDEQLNKMEEVGEYILWTSLVLERLTAEFVEGRYLSDTINELRKRLWEDDLSAMTVNASVSKLRPSLIQRLNDEWNINCWTGETEDWFNKTIETQLNKRGKGEWRCVRGLKCKQGGVVDGVVRVFERHSEFK